MTAAESSNAVSQHITSTRIKSGTGYVEELPGWFRRLLYILMVVFFALAMGSLAMGVKSVLSGTNEYNPFANRERELAAQRSKMVIPNSSLPNPVTLNSSRLLRSSNNSKPVMAVVSPHVAAVASRRATQTTTGIHLPRHPIPPVHLKSGRLYVDTPTPSIRQPALSVAAIPHARRVVIAAKPNTVIGKGLTIVGFPSQSIVLIKSLAGGQTVITPYQVGQELPSGARILSIHQTAGEIMTDMGELKAP